MNFRQIKLVYFKEMKDILRDKRTLRLMILVPMVFYPLMSFGVTSLAMGMAKKQAAKAAPVLVVGCEQGSIVDSLLTASEERVLLVDEASFSADVALLDRAEYAAAVNHLAAWQLDPREGLSDTLKAAFYYSAIKGKIVDCVVELPADFDLRVQSPESLAVTVYYDEQEFRSDAAESKVRKALESWRDALSVSLLVQSGVHDAAARHALMPFTLALTDVAPAEKKTGFFLALMLPYMIVLMVMLGAMYPAIDLTAGEKERGTLETILASPVGRTEVTMGKFLCVFSAAMATVILGSLSMTITSSFGAMQMSDAAAQGTAPGFALSVNPMSIFIVILLMIPTAVLFSAALLAISVMARSYKEAQSYISPLMFLVILPSMIVFMPGVELNTQLALVPVSNIALGVRAAMLTAKGEAFPWGNLGLVLISTTVYAGVALFMVRQMFNKESVLFRT
jgi:sodium transport system permease protein